MLFQAIFFDIDDTIMDFKQCSRAALCKSFHELNIKWNDTTIDLFYEIDDALWKRQRQGILSVQEVLNNRFEILFNQLGIKIDSKICRNLFSEKLGQEHILETAAYETIINLSSRYKLYVASNGIKKMQLSRLSLAGLLPYFTDIFVSDDIGFEKPDIRFFNECLRRSGLEAENILFIGDSLEADIKGCQSKGIAACWYNPKHISRPHNQSLEYEIDNLQELRKFL